MKILAIDPGSQNSAWVLYDGVRILEKGLTSNQELLSMLGVETFDRFDLGTKFYIEMVGHYGRGMAAGKEVFDTCVWIGRFIQAWGLDYETVLRPTVKTHICGVANANDANVRQAVWDRFGGRKTACGTKRNPGPLHGVVKDIMQAFALALYAANSEKKAG